MELPFTSQWSWDNSNCTAVQSCYAQWGLESNLASAVLIMFCLVLGNEASCPARISSCNCI